MYRRQAPEAWRLEKCFQRVLRSTPAESRVFGDHERQEEACCAYVPQTLTLQLGCRDERRMMHLRGRRVDHAMTQSDQLEERMMLLHPADCRSGAEACVESRPRLPCAPADGEVAASHDATEARPLEPVRR